MSEEQKFDKEMEIKEYELALSLLAYHDGLLWQEFGVFLLAQTVLLGFLGSSLSQCDWIGKNWRVFGGSFLGFILCLPWLSTYLHNYQYRILRILQARRHEKKLGFSLLQDGAQLSSGQRLKIDGMTVYISKFAVFLSPQRSFKWMIYLFGVIFAILIVIAGPWF